MHKLILILISAALARQGLPGVSVAVVRDGRIVLSQGYGLRDVATRAPVDENTEFEIGSITKQFTAAAILQLKERGKLKLSDRLGKYVPEYARAKNVTLEQMLYQTSGIPDHINQVPHAVEIITTRAGGLDAVLGLIKDTPLHFKPGTQWEYSNTNYYLLGTIVERVSHMPFDRYVSTHIFGPAHMTHSAFLKDEPWLADMSVGYTVNDAGKLVRGGHIGYGWSAGNGSIVSTAGDVARWDEAFFGGRIVSPSDVALATTSGRLRDGKKTAYGFGWSIDRLDGIPEILHDGGMLGFAATNDVYPTLGLSIIVLANRATASPTAIARNILATLSPTFARKRNAAVPGENPLITARVQRVWRSFREGRPDRSQLTGAYAASLNPGVVRFWRSFLARIDTGSPPVKWIYKEKTPSGEDESYLYRVILKDGSAMLIAANIAKDGKVSDFQADYD